LVLVTHIKNLSVHTGIILNDQAIKRSSVSSA
jgi:hypothetical protein